MTCDQATRKIFLGGYFAQLPTLFQLLEEWGFHTGEEERKFPYFAVYDFEAILKPTEKEAGPRTTLLSDHVPVSVSVASNATYPTCDHASDASCGTCSPLRNPHFAVDTEPKELINKFISRLSHIQGVTSSHMRSKFSHIFKALETESPVQTMRRTDGDEQDDTMDDNDENMDDDQGSGRRNICCSTWFP